MISMKCEEIHLHSVNNIQILSQTIPVIQGITGMKRSKIDELFQRFSNDYHLEVMIYLLLKLNKKSKIELLFVVHYNILLSSHVHLFLLGHLKTNSNSLNRRKFKTNSDCDSWKNDDSSGSDYDYINFSPTTFALRTVWIRQHNRIATILKVFQISTFLSNTIGKYDIIVCIVVYLKMNYLTI